MSAEVNPLTGVIVNITNQVINKISCISKDGDQVGTVPLSLGVPLVRVISDGDGKKQNRLLILRSDANGYDPVFVQHTHSPEDSINDGGDLYSILAANSKYVLDFNNESATKGQFHSRVQGTTPVSTIDDTLEAGYSYILLTSKYDSGATLGRSATLIRGGIRLDFGYPFVLTFKQALSHNTDLVYRGGCNLPYTEALAGIQNQVGIEVCSSSSVNYQVVSGNGSTRSGLALSGSNAQQANFTGYKIQYTPSDKIIFQDGFGNEVIKITDLPASNSGTDSDSTFRVGLYTSNSTDKLLKYAASRLLGRKYDINVGIGAWL